MHGGARRAPVPVRTHTGGRRKGNTSARDGAKAAPDAGTGAAAEERALGCQATTIPRLGKGGPSVAQPAPCRAFRAPQPSSPSPPLTSSRAPRSLPSLTRSAPPTPSRRLTGPEICAPSQGAVPLRVGLECSWRFSASARVAISGCREPGFFRGEF